jgi:hypothetical protein
MNQELLSMQEKGIDKLIDDFNEVKRKFQEAKSGQSSWFGAKGGLEGLVNTIRDEQSAQKIRDFIETTDRAIDLSLKILHSKEDLNKSNILEEKPEQEAPAPDLSKMLLYYVTYFYNSMMNIANPVTGWDWWNKVYEQGSEQIYIGAIPVSTVFGTDHAKDIHALGVRAVLSVVEPFELGSAGPLTAPITGNRWKELGVNHLELPTEDFKTIPHEEIEKGVKSARDYEKRCPEASESESESEIEEILFEGSSTSLGGSSRLRKSQESETSSDGEIEEIPVGETPSGLRKSLEETKTNSDSEIGEIDSWEKGIDTETQRPKDTED